MCCFSNSLHVIAVSSVVRFQDERVEPGTGTVTYRFQHVKSDGKVGFQCLFAEHKN